MLHCLGSVRFLHDHSRLITIGTDDRTILQWTFRSESDSVGVVDARGMNAAPMATRGVMSAYATPDDIDGTIEDVQLLESAQHTGAYVDSDSEDSDSDLSSGEIDSDVEKEKQISYDRTLYREDYQVRTRTYLSSTIVTCLPMIRN
jgi:hypothetical protein